MRSRRFVRRLAACLAVVSLFGWLELPREHIHNLTEDGHDIEYVHRHVELHVPVHHDQTVVDHEDEATYLDGSAATFTQVASPDPHFVVLPSRLSAGVARPSDGWLNPLLVVHVHAPPWRDLYSRRGPPIPAV